MCFKCVTMHLLLRHASITFSTWLARHICLLLATVVAGGGHPVRRFLWCFSWATPTLVSRVNVITKGSVNEPRATFGKWLATVEGVSCNVEEYYLDLAEKQPCVQFKELYGAISLSHDIIKSVNMSFFNLICVKLNDQDTRHISVHKNGSLIETFVSKNSNIHSSKP